MPKSFQPHCCESAIRTTGFTLILILILPCAFVSCSRPDYSSEISGIDSLLNEIAAAEKEFMSVDTTLTDSISIKASNQINMIKHIYDTDTIDMPEAKIITTYKVLRKTGQKARQQRFEIRDETNYTRNQLNILKNWMEAGRTPEDSGKFYYNQEKQATMALLAAYEAYMINLRQTKHLYDSLNPEIERIINERRGSEINDK